jgi:hypothetical protein
MKKIKLFKYNVQIMQSAMGKMSFVNEATALENEVNEFLSKDGKEIEVIDVKYQQSTTSAAIVETVMVYYKEL